MPNLGVTPGGSHEWRISDHGPIRKPVKFDGSDIGVEPMKRDYSKDVYIGDLMIMGIKFPVYGPKRPWWKRLFDFIKAYIERDIEIFSDMAD